VAQIGFKGEKIKENMVVIHYTHVMIEGATNPWLQPQIHSATL
jgi:hypothetical protein